jgi:hypothetical protein
MSENVQIPLSLFNQTIDLLVCIDVGEYDAVIFCYYQTVLSAFLRKRQSLDLRKSYAKIIFAKDEDERFDARINYLCEKRHFSDGL